MSETANTSATVHRLIDMVVEEVSLVDRAANKHRFLVVKRDEPMADKTSKTGSPPEASSGAPEAEGVVQMSKAIGDALGIATSALEALTGAIEQLGQAEGDSDKNPVVTDLAEQLSEVARQLATSAGIEPTEEEPESQTSEQGSEASSVYNDVRSMLSRVSELLNAESEKGTPDQAAPPSTDAASTPEPQGDAAAEVTKQLSSVAASLRAISDAMKDQSQRLGRLEKGVGLPNSRQAPERPAPRPESQEVSWPLDLNRRMDRESVEKDVSFHDR